MILTGSLALLLEELNRPCCCEGEHNKCGDNGCLRHKECMTALIRWWRADNNEPWSRAGKIGRHGAAKSS